MFDLIEIGRIRTAIQKWQNKLQESLSKHPETKQELFRPLRKYLSKVSILRLRMPKWITCTI